MATYGGRFTLTERLRVTFALDCCAREALHWAVTIGGFNSETLQNVMLGTVECRFRGRRENDKA